MVYSPYFPQGAIRIYPETTAQEFEGVRKPVTNQDNLEKAIAIATLPSKYHPSVYDRGIHLREETWGQFIEWRKTGEDDQTLDLVKPEKSIGIMMPTKGTPHHANVVGVKLPYAHAQLNMRDVGKYVTRYGNFKHDLTNYMRGDSGQALAKFLNKSGLKADDIEYIAVGFLPDSAIYAVGRLANGKVVIYSHEDAHQKISDWACREGTKPEEVKEAAIGEEITHIFRNSKPSIAEERETKTMLMEMYKGLASKATDSKLRAKYDRIIRHLESDIDTVGRYAQEYSGLSSLVSLFNSDAGKLEVLLEAKAIAEEGITSKEGVRGYVSRSLEAIAKAAGKYSAKSDYKSGKGGNAKSSSKVGKGADSSKDGEAAAEAESEGAEGEESGDGEAAYTGNFSGECAEGGESGSEGGGDSGEGGSGGDGGGSGGE
ncbi:MAG: hypothetical protein KKC75_05995 [Nanoarchaeota archaeon]|nr:hypothetical protein [Nanoarchaeota archaeon]